MNAMVLRPGRPGRWTIPTAGRGAGIALVVLLHVGLVYALIAGLEVRTPAAPPPVIHVTDLPKTPPVTEETLAPPPTGELVQTRIYVPDPPIKVETLPPLEGTPTAVGGQQERQAFVVPPRPVPVEVMPRIDEAHSVRPDYPALARRLGEEGTVLLSVLVDPSGNVADARVDHTSGILRLDQAAIEGVKRGYHFAPGTVDGRPTAMWRQIVVAFRLTDPR